MQDDRAFTCTHAALPMGIISSWNRQLEEARAKARSDAIDLNIEQESKSFKRQCDVLLMSSYDRILIF
jgi:hypothetical protein